MFVGVWEEGAYEGAGGRTDFGLMGGGKLRVHRQQRKPERTPFRLGLRLPGTASAGSVGLGAFLQAAIPRNLRCRCRWKLAGAIWNGFETSLASHVCREI